MRIRLLYNFILSAMSVTQYNPQQNRTSTSIWTPPKQPSGDYLYVLEKQQRPRRSRYSEQGGFRKPPHRKPSVSRKPSPFGPQPPILNLIFPSERKSPKQSDSSESGTFQLEDVKGHYNMSCIGGYRELKEELHQVMDLLMNSQNYTQYGVRIPRGVLLEGPAGNGKTLMAKCLAGEANLNFVSCSGSEFNEKYVGVGAARIRELFEFAKKNKPCIVFIDEMDAVGRKRSGDGENAGAERDGTLNQLLVMMDGFKDSCDVFVIGATNRVDILDPALIRPGRIDKIIHVPHPDVETRHEIVKIHGYKKPLNVTYEYIARVTQGMSGAQIENLLNEAVLYGLRHGVLPISSSLIDQMKEKMIVGRTSQTSKKVLSEKAIRRIAIHEIGHLVMALQSQHYEKPWKVTIDSMNPKQSLGYTLFHLNEENLYVREYFNDQIKTLLGGRVAEEVFYGDSISSGAISDLESAFSVAKKMITEYGMGKHIIYPYFSETYKKKIDEQIHGLILKLHRETIQFMTLYKPQVEQLANILIEKQTLHEDEIQSLYQELFP